MLLPVFVFELFPAYSLGYVYAELIPLFNLNNV